jgi:hypothetical protein
MVNKSMLDTVTVVFKEELPILKVQAESINLYAQEIGIQTIFVIVNDDDNVVDQINLDWWGSFRDRVRIIPRSYFGCTFVENGWVSQQALKILASALSTNQFSMILDAKTIIVKKAVIDLILPGGNPIGGTHPIPEVFYPSARIIGELFGVTLTRNGGSSGVPFIFNNNIIRDMLVEIKSRTGQEFSDWFQEQGMVTEYLLYVGYNLYLHRSMDKFYSLTYPYTVANLCHNQTGIIEEKLIEMLEPDKLTISVHRRAWAVMNEKQRSTYKQILVSRGLTTAQELV